MHKLRQLGKVAASAFWQHSSGPDSDTHGVRV